MDYVIKFGDDSDVAAEAFEKAQERISKAESFKCEISAYCESMIAYTEVNRPEEADEVSGLLMKKLKTGPKPTI